MQKIITICIILFFFPCFALAQVSYPEKKEEYVSDYTGILGDVSSLNEEIEQFEKDTSYRINIAVLNTLEDESIDDYANRLYDKWRVGRNKDDGILIIVCLQDKKIYIKVGYGLQGAVTADISKEILKGEINPSFQEGMYLEGLEKGSRAIMEAVLGEYEKDKKNNYGHFIFAAILLSIFVILFIFSNIKLKKKNNLRKIRNI